MASEDTAPAAGEVKTVEERSAILDHSIQVLAAQGWRVQSRTPTQAQLVKGQRVNHILHLLLTIITFGIWAIVWLIVAVRGGEEHAVVTIDEHGEQWPRVVW
jgi:hypothetical protein